VQRSECNCAAALPETGGQASGTTRRRNLHFSGACRRGPVLGKMVLRGGVELDGSECARDRGLAGQCRRHRELVPVVGTRHEHADRHRPARVQREPASLLLAHRRDASLNRHGRVGKPRRLCRHLRRRPRRRRIDGRPVRLHVLRSRVRGRRRLRLAAAGKHGEAKEDRQGAETTQRRHCGFAFRNGEGEEVRPGSVWARGGGAFGLSRAPAPSPATRADAGDGLRQR